MKILLLGSTGQVGWELRRSLAPLGQLVLPSRTASDGLPAADFGQPDTLAALVDQLRPAVIVNAAAYTAVDKAEADEQQARSVNAQAPAVLAQAAARSGALLIHYSTDYVFDGSGTRPWTEDDATGPLSAYGRTKLEGERAIAAAGCRHLIFRTSWVYAARGGNFARTMLRLAAERDRLTVIDDQHGAPTGADLIADVSAHALRSTLDDPSRCGLYHLVAGGCTTWNRYARFVLEHAVQGGVQLKAGPGQVDPCPTSAFPTPARRPLNSRLDTSRLRKAFGLELPDWEQGVSRMLSEIL